MRLIERHQRKAKRFCRGAALLLVLWIITLLMLMLGALAIETRTTQLAVRNRIALAQAQALAEGGIWRGLYEMLAPKITSPWLPDGTEHLLEDSNPIGILYVSVQDLRGLIDLNSAPPDLLMKLFLSILKDEARAGEIVDRIVDWRDRDNIKRASGAETEQYLAAGRREGAKNWPFYSVGELKRVSGIDTELFQAAAPSITVWSQHRGVNLNVAPRHVLAQVLEGSDGIVDEFLNSRSAGAPPLLSLNLPAYLESGSSNGTGNMFQIVAVAEVSGVKRRVSAIIGLTPKVAEGFEVLSWREEFPPASVATE